MATTLWPQQWPARLFTITAQVALDSSADRRWTAVLPGTWNTVDPDALSADGGAAATAARQMETAKENLV